MTAANPGASDRVKLELQRTRRTTRGRLLASMPDLTRAVVSNRLAHLRRKGLARLEGTRATAVWVWLGPSADPNAPPPPPPEARGSILIGAPVLVAIARMLRPNHPHPMSPRQVRATLGCSRRAAHNALLRLLHGGLAERTGWRRDLHYRLTDAGLAALQDEVVKARPVRTPPHVSDVDQIASYLAQHGVTRCPHAYAAAVTGAADLPGRLPTPETPSQWRARRHGDIREALAKRTRAPAKAG